MGYSKITSVEVINFMVYRHAKVSFDEGNILNIKGYNSAGKSTLLKAIGVCLMNMFPRAQAKLISHGEDYFRIIVSFDDGVSIVRDKYSNGQSLYEMYHGADRIFTTKEGNRLGRVEDVPQTIQDYLGLCSTSYGYLNYQSRQDKLWLVETTGSENYCSLNEILRSEEISRANALINTDRNKLVSEITGMEHELQAVKSQRYAVEAFTPELLQALELRERDCKALMARKAAIENLLSTVENVQGIVVPPEVERIDDSRLKAVGNILSTIETLEGIVVPPEVSVLDGKRLAAVESFSKMLKQLEEVSAGVVGTNVPTLSVERFSTLLKVVPLLKELGENVSTLKRLDSEYSEVSDELSSEVAKAAEKGIRYVRCENCGTYTGVNLHEN